MKVKVGKTLEYTIIVSGDIDGDTIITVNDLARLKKHLIGIKGEALEGIELKAADIDEDSDITVNDVAKTKLEIIKNSLK